MEMILLVDVNINYLKQAKHIEIKDAIVAQSLKQLVETHANYSRIKHFDRHCIVKQKLECFLEQCYTIM